MQHAGDDGDRRFRGVGVLARQGESLGFNTDEVVIVPVAAAQALFNTESLFRILAEAKSREQVVFAKEDAIEILRERHEGERDVTVITLLSLLLSLLATLYPSWRAARTSPASRPSRARSCPAPRPRGTTRPTSPP